MKWERMPFKMEKQYRKRSWDYSKNGYYFVTICTENHVNLFRDIKNDRTNLFNKGTDTRICSYGNKNKIIGDVNIAGEMITKWWLKIPEKFDSIILDEFVVMPNHFHGILIIKKEGNNLGISNKNYYENKQTPNIEGKQIFNAGEEQIHGSVPTLDHNIFGNVGLLGQAIQWFKIMSTNEYIRNIKENNWPRFSKRLWQTRFHDRIIKLEKGFWATRTYIQDNPRNWGKDKFNIFN